MHVNTSTLYRLSDDGPDVMTGAELEGAIRAETPSDRPEHPLFPVAEYRCEAAGCPVRVVRVEASYVYQRRLRTAPDMRCPGCERTMRFAHYLRRVMLLPVREAEVGCTPQHNF